MLDRPTELSGSAPVPDGGARRTPSGPEHRLTRDSLPGFVSALRQRRTTLVATMLAVPLCAYLVLSQITPRYTATGSLIYQISEYQPRQLQSMVQPSPVTEATITSQAEVLESQHVAQRVAERGNLFANPEFNPFIRPPGLIQRLTGVVRRLLGMESGNAPQEPVYGPVIDRPRDITVMAVQAALHASPVRFSHVVEVTFTANDPTVAAAAVNNAMDIYIKGLYADRHAKIEAGTNLLLNQAKELRRVVEREEEKVSAYRAQHGLSQGIHAGTDTEQISHLSEDLAKAKSERASADAKLDAARGRAGATAQAAVAPSVERLREQQQQLAGQIKAQQARLGSAHPEVQGLGRQFAETQRALADETARVIAATEAEQHAAADRVATLERNLREAEAAATQAAKEQLPLNGIDRDLEAAREQLRSVLGLIQQTAHQTSLETSEAHEISQALPPERPESPRMVPAMAAAVAAGIFLGLMLVYVLYLTDSTLRSGDDLRLITGLPCLALIPEVGKRVLGHLKIHDYIARRPLTAFAEQVRSLRAGVSLDIAHPQIITITAARPAEGKSLLTLALGRSAQLGGERVLAIECDVRRATFQHRLDGRPAPGLMEILRGEAAWRDAVQDDPVTGMGFIAAGKPGGDVLGLFLSEPMRQLLAQVRDHYDLILLDAPPVEAMTEARVAAALADATLLCVRWRSTQTKTLLRAMEMLRDAHAKIIGTVLTRVDPRVHLRSGYADAGVYHRRYKAYFRG
ncbi:MAG: hypothetical protein P4L90_03915 [Rhodopila sp.]|nr:hypothetical protein [Rhodopila sp.]